MPPTKQEIEEQIAHEKAVIHELLRRKRILEIQAAQAGNNARPEVLTEMSDLGDKIRAHEQAITRLESLPTADKQLTVLYVEDLQHHAEQYLKVLRAQFGADQVTHVKTARRALTELYEHPPDVLVADLHIPPGPSYAIPVEAEGLPRIGGLYAYGTDICAVALHRGIPVVALSTAPVRHPVREPIEQARRKYGGMLCHVYKEDTPDATQLISSILQSYGASSEAEKLTKKLNNWLREQWLDAEDISARLAILNEVHMALESASQPTRAALQAGPTGVFVRDLLLTHAPGSEDERVLLEQVTALLSDDTSDFDDTRLAPG